MACTEKISVIMPVYNTGKYLENTVRSVMDQTYDNLEIICVNDGSTDNSLEILQKLALEDSRIVVIDKENTGQSDSRNRGLEVATSEWILFIDSDDTLVPDALETVSSAFSLSPDMIHFGISVVHEDGRTPSKDDVNYYSVKYVGLHELNDNMIMVSDASPCNKVFRKSILDTNNIRFEKIYYEDFAFVMQYLFSIRKVFYFKERLYQYMRHEGSIMAQTFGRTPRAIDHLKAVDYVYKYLDKKGVLAEHEGLLTRFFVDCYFFAIHYTVREKLPEVVGLATDIHKKWAFLHKRLRRSIENRTVLFVRKRRSSSKMLQKLFSMKIEYLNYTRYKVVRLFNVIVYKELRSAMQ